LNPAFIIEIFDDKTAPYQLGSTDNQYLPKVRTMVCGYHFWCICTTDTVGLSVKERGQNCEQKLKLPAL